MDFSKLWSGYKFPTCENCKKDCKGHLDYDNLCSNLNYLNEYAEKNYEKNKGSFIELKRVLGNRKPNIVSFGCGLGLDFVCAKEVFNESFNYYGIDECDWAIKKTDNYKNFMPKLPKTVKFDDGILFLNILKENVVLCFFNSLFTISNNTNLDEELFKALQKMNNFYIVCDYTINSNLHMPKEEQDFLKKMKNKLRGQFRFKQYEILNGSGIIISGER